MRIAILETGAPPADLAGTYGSYPQMFERLLAADGLSFQAYKVTEGHWPEPGSFDALLITGSPAGAYDPLPWIAPLKDFLNQAKAKPMVGICFGHQIMAEAFGGHVEKSAKGWGVGLNHYRVLAREPWMDDGAAFAIPASHQDQVVVQPPHTRVIAASDFTPFAALAYADQPAISFQGHPEFDPAYAGALIRARRGTRFSEAEADAAVASLEQPNDRARVGEWIARFLKAATATSPAAASS
ncbi:MAG: type 1 glutamine amidotransferase [Caulobacteraceae bacterium]